MSVQKCLWQHNFHWCDVPIEIVFRFDRIMTLMVLYLVVCTWISGRCGLDLTTSNQHRRAIASPLPKEKHTVPGLESHIIRLTNCLKNSTYPDQVCIGIVWIIWTELSVVIREMIPMCYMVFPKNVLIVFPRCQSTLLCFVFFPGRCCRGKISLVSQPRNSTKGHLEEFRWREKNRWMVWHDGCKVILTIFCLQHALKHHFCGRFSLRET